MRRIALACVVLAGCASHGSKPLTEQQRACRLPPGEFASYVAVNVALGSDPHFLADLRAVCPEKVARALEP